jgi:hypothetical protein
VISSNSGLCPGSTQPAGDFIRATLTVACPELTRPAYSSIRLGLFPAAAITVGRSISVGMRETSHALGREARRGPRQRGAGSKRDDDVAVARKTRVRAGACAPTRTQLVRMEGGATG